MREVKFAKVHMFPFSSRPRTRAAIMPNHIPHEIIKDRKQKVMRLSEKMAYELREKYVGCTMTILSEGNDSGHTDNYLNVLIRGESIGSNELVNVELVENSPSGLIGKVRTQRACGE